MTTPDPYEARVQVDPGESPPAITGSFADAERLRQWSFRRRTPAQRLEWLISMLKVAYASGALKPRGPTE